MVPNGFSAGVAPSDWCNKAWRQPAFMGSALAQFVMETLDQDTRDNGDRPLMVGQIREAVRRVGGGGVTVDTTRFLFRDGSQSDMTAGYLTLANHPVQLMHAATRGWVLSEIDRVTGATGYVSEAPSGDVIYGRYGGPPARWADIGERFLRLTGGTLRAPGGGPDTLNITSPAGTGAGLTLQVDGQPTWWIQTGQGGNFNIQDWDGVTLNTNFTIYKTSHNVAIRGNDLAFEGALDMQWLTRPQAHQSLGITRQGGGNINQFIVMADVINFTAGGTWVTNLNIGGNVSMSGALLTASNTRFECRDLMAYGAIMAGTWIKATSDLTADANLNVGGFAYLARARVYYGGSDPLVIGCNPGQYARAIYQAYGVLGGDYQWTLGLTPDDTFLLANERTGAIPFTADPDGSFRMLNNAVVGDTLYCNHHRSYGGTGWIAFYNHAEFAGNLWVNGHMTAGGSGLSVNSGAFAVNGTLDAPTFGNVRIYTALTVDGGTNLSGGLQVWNQFNCWNNAYVAGTLNVNGVVGMNQHLTVAGNLSANDFTLNGQLFIGGSGGVAGSLTLSGNLGANWGTFGGAVSVGLTLQVNGNATIYGNIYTNSITYPISDRRVKGDPQPLQRAAMLEAIRPLQPVSYTLNSDKRHYGLLSQDVAETVLCDAVATGPGGKLYLDYNHILAALVGAVQQLDTRIAALESRGG